MEQVTLPATCNREAAIELWSRLRHRAASELSFDGSAVEAIGQSMLQVLLALGGGVQPLPVANPSPAMREVLQLCGLASPTSEEAAR